MEISNEMTFIICRTLADNMKFYAIQKIKGTKITGRRGTFQFLLAEKYCFSVSY
jgi:hypothetical protein